MIRLQALALDQQTSTRLAEYQAEVDGAGAYDIRVAEAKRLFSLRNKSGDPAFAEVRRTLTLICSGAMRCAYCEDSARDQVEHIAPKDWFPERVFVWGNYVYACGRCNRPKSNKFAVFAHATGQKTDLQRGRKDPILPPTPGDPVLLNPRVDDPLDYLELDLQGTFYFIATAPVTTREGQRAEYTIELLGLNARDELPVARADAYGNYRARLREYVHQKAQGADQSALDRLRDSLLRSNHPTVWREMVRQQARISELRELFAQAPEALNW